MSEEKKGEKHSVVIERMVGIPVSRIENAPDHLREAFSDGSLSLLEFSKALDIHELEKTIGYVVQKFFVCKQENKWDSNDGCQRELRHYLNEVTNKLHAVCLYEMGYENVEECRSLNNFNIRIDGEDA